MRSAYVGFLRCASGDFASVAFVSKSHLHCLAFRLWNFVADGDDRFAGSELGMQLHHIAESVGGEHVSPGREKNRD